MSLILEQFNLRGFWLINDWAGQMAWLDWFMIFSAEWLGYFLILIPVILFLKGKNRKGILIAFVSAVIARFVLVEIIRYFIYSPRPFLILENVKQLISHEMTSSFPSGHASFFFALAMGVYFYNKKAGLIYFVLAGLIGLSRIFTGVHWPLDVLAGAVLGVLTSFGINFLIKKMPLFRA